MLITLLALWRSGREAQHFGAHIKVASVGFSLKIHPKSFRISPQAEAASQSIHTLAKKLRNACKLPHIHTQCTSNESAPVSRWGSDTYKRYTRGKISYNKIRNHQKHFTSLHANQTTLADDYCRDVGTNNATEFGPFSALFLQTGSPLFFFFLVLLNDSCQKKLILFPNVFMPEWNKALHGRKAFQCV